MRLPWAAWAVVDSAKLTEYLLSTTHPVGRFKAAYFERLGYFPEDWLLLEAALLDLSLSGTVERIEETPYGRKYRVRGMIEPPIGGTITLVTAWIVPTGLNTPRFVTAFPGEES